MFLKNFIPIILKQNFFRKVFFKEKKMEEEKKNWNILSFSKGSFGFVFSQTDLKTRKTYTEEFRKREREIAIFLPETER